MSTALRGLMAGLVLCVGVSAYAQDGRGLELRMGEGNWPAWQGVGAGEASLNTGNMMYPGGGGLEGFLAAVITHGLILHSSRAAMRNEQQAKADQVLNPHRNAIDGLTAEKLISATRDQLPPADRQAQQVLELRPAYTLSADERTLMLDNAIRVQAAQGKPLDRIVRVLAPALDTADPSAYWQQDQGRPLQQQAATLLAHSIQLALSIPPSAADGKPAKTLRYRSGSADTMERGKLLAMGCNRIVMETLRGWILSAPRTDAQPETCATQPYAFEAADLTATGATPAPRPATGAADPAASTAVPADPATPPR
ncbi:MAG: hypothetical protein ACR2JA_13165 [Hydrogenophaga sp.]|uniref:hypothetical protein n=1 Tax=Hydrogenophaga sp. TaxID=1904254 RepID=UPI003D9B7EB5